MPPVFRLRWKILLLLLTISLGPLTIALWIGRAGALRAADDLAQDVRNNLLSNAEQFLLKTVRDHARLVQREGELLEQNLTFLAREAEHLLDEPPPNNIPLIKQGVILTTPTESQPNNPHPADHPHLAAAYEQQGFYHAPGTETAAVADDQARLTRILPIFQTIQESQPNYIFWQYLTLENGLHTFYPGQGTLPTNYDPRQRPWYQRAINTKGLVWNPLTIDVATRHTVLTLSIPVFRNDETLTGVAGIDTRLTDVIQTVQLPPEWSDVTDVMLVVAEPDPISDPPNILILARREYEAPTANTQPQLEHLNSPDREEFELVRSDLSANLADVRTLTYRGLKSLWAYAPLEDAGAALVAIIPYKTVLAPARAAEQRVHARIDAQARLVIFLILGVIVVVVLSSLSASRHVTKPIQELAAAARRIASGDFNTPSRVRTRDELGHLATAVNRMLPQLRERIRLKQSLTVAMEVQQHLLPQDPPRIPGLDVAGQSLYCDETGGDYFDFVELTELGPHRLGVAVGDVAGHGIAAALLMATARALLRSRAGDPADLGNILNHMNRHLTQDVPVGRFMTLGYFLIDVREHAVRWANAGHDPAIIYDPATDAFNELDGGGLPLGIDAHWKYEDLGPRVVAPGQILVIGTDGIWEARNPQGQMFGKGRLQDIIREHHTHSARDISTAITLAVSAFHGHRTQDDDITLVVIKFQTRP